MPRLLAFGGDSNNGHKRLEDFDSVDLEALSLAHAWGANGNGAVTYVKPSPCRRPGCGGSILVFGDSRHAFFALG